MNRWEHENRKEMIWKQWDATRKDREPTKKKKERRQPSSIKTRVVKIAKII